MDIELITEEQFFTTISHIVKYDDLIDFVQHFEYEKGQSFSERIERTIKFLEQAEVYLKDNLIEPDYITENLKKLRSYSLEA